MARPSTELSRSPGLYMASQDVTRMARTRNQYTPKLFKSLEIIRRPAVRDAVELKFWKLPCLYSTFYHLPSFATRTRTWNLRSSVQLLGKHQSRPSPPRARPQRWVNYSSRFNGADNLFFPFPRPRMKKHFWKWDHGRERHKLHMRLTAKERNMGENRWRHEGIINTKCIFLQEKRLRGINCLAKEDLWRLSQIKWIVWREWTVHRKYAMVQEMIFCFIRYLQVAGLWLRNHRDPASFYFIFSYILLL